MDNDLNQPFFVVNTSTISRRRRIIEEEPTSRRAIQRRYLDRGLGENREKQRGRQYLRDLMRDSTDVVTHDDYNAQMNEMVAQFGRVRDRLLRAAYCAHDCGYGSGYGYCHGHSYGHDSSRGCGCSCIKKLKMITKKTRKAIKFQQKESKTH